MKTQLILSGTTVTKSARPRLKTLATLAGAAPIVAALLLPATSADAQPPDPPPKPPVKPARKPRRKAPARPAEKQPAEKAATEKPATEAAPAKTPPIPTEGVPYDPFPRPPRKEPQVIMSLEYMNHRTIGNDTAWMLKQEKYDELEQKADEFRKSKEAFSKGEWKLTTFYNGVTQFGEDDPGDEVVASLRKWAAARPTSITAQVALADGLVEYAWKARGTGGGHSVSPEQWEVFRERLQEARLVLREAKKLPQKCPHWWAVAQTIALGQGWEREAYDGLYQEAIAFEPGYNLFYFNRGNFLLTRWYGEPGEAEAFAVEAADYVAKKKSPEAGDILYARIFWNWAFMHNDEINHHLPVVSYERMERGFQAMLKQYPDNVAVQSAWAKLCGLTATPATVQQRKAKARELLKEIDNRIDFWVFYYYYDTDFPAFKKWALSD